MIPITHILNFSNSKTNTGAIAGGVVGGLVGLIAILLVCLFFIRRRRLHMKEKAHNTPVDLFQGDHEDGVPDRGELPQFYQPEPFLVADPTVASSHGHDSYDHRQSTLTSTTDDQLLRSGTPDPQGLGVGSVSASNQTRKSPLGPAQLRPVNVIQHDDAGDVEEADETQETIELPPAYTNIRRPPGTKPPPAANDTTNNETAPSSST
jgi:hypothetical protein